MHYRTLLAIAALGCTVLIGAVRAGDRDAVNEQLEAISPTWSDALFSIDVKGPSDDGDAVLNQRLAIAYDAASPGYLAWLRVSSHGDMTLYRDPGHAKPGGTQPYVIKPPLGSEQVIVLFASAPWDSLFSAGATTREVGSSADDAADFARRIAQLDEAHVRIAVRRYQLNIVTAAGGTEYTTRAIVRRVQDGSGGSGGGTAVARIPSRIAFEFGSDQLTTQGKLDLDTFGEALVTDLRSTDVSLEGHTDAVGTDDYNVGLSQRRAMAARQYLCDSFGITPSRLAAVGKGKDDPVASNDDAAGRAQNRRVDFIFGPQSVH
ncbi:MAG TPA: OmpA family protein [Steroidobacteraceae bacterium]|jgi:OOP family OmpA-OmpF porin|nr:OmpA family protein [Steroidobacteraceae bacterium]